MTNGDVEIQKEVLTPFLINLDYLGWGSGLSPEYQAEWGSHLVNSFIHSKARRPADDKNY